MARNGWDTLSPAVRRRYERAGVTRADYEAGEPLSAARGHGSTPERPSRAGRKGLDYAPYRVRREPTHGPGGPVRVWTVNGPVWVRGLSKEDKSLVASHNNAVKEYLHRNDAHQKHTFSTNISDYPMPFSTHTPDLSSFKDATVVGYRINSEVPETFQLCLNGPAIEYMSSRAGVEFEGFYREG